MLKVVEVVAKKTVFNGLFKFEEGVTYPVRNSRDGSKIMIRDAHGVWVTIKNRHQLQVDVFTRMGMLMDDLFDTKETTFVKNWDEMNIFLNRESQTV